MGNALVAFLGPCVGSRRNSLAPEDYFRATLIALFMGFVGGLSMIFVPETTLKDMVAVDFYCTGAILVMELFSRYLQGSEAP